MCILFYNKRTIVNVQLSLFWDTGISLEDETSGIKNLNLM